MTVDPLQPYCNCPKATTVIKDRGPTVNKAIIVSRHVGRRYPTTNQRNTKMIVIMMIMIIIIIINIIMSMGLPNTPSRSKHAGGYYPTHTTPQGGKGGNHQSPHPNHTTPQGGGKQPTTTPQHTTGGEGSNPQPWGTIGGGGDRPNRDHIYIYIHIHLYIYSIYTSIHLYIYTYIHICKKVFGAVSHVSSPPPTPHGIHPKPS